MIRLAARDDIPAMLAILRRHHSLHRFDWRFDPVRLSMLLAHAIAAPDWLVITGDGVLLLARYFECEFGSGRHALERVLYAERGAGSALIDRYEQWARANGCVSTSLSSMRKPTAFARLYRRLGYRLAETAFVKAL